MAYITAGLERDVIILPPVVSSDVLDEAIDHFHNFFWWFGGHFGDPSTHNTMAA
jgi:hypothetical protein